MAKCQHCGERKGKRTCPYLRGLICAACCGENRLTVFPCPDACVYLHSADTYQKKRAASAVEVKFLDRYAEYVQSGKETLARNLWELEKILYEVSTTGPRIDDAEILDALYYLRRAFSAVVTVENLPSRLGREIQAKLQEPRGEGIAPRRYELQEGVEELLKFIKSVSSCEPGTLDYVTILRHSGEQMKFVSATPAGGMRSSRIVLPGEG